MEEMEVYGITYDAVKNSPVLLLRNSGKTRLLPIWIGPFEANAILMEMEGKTPPRPLTHDLTRKIIFSLGATVERIVINDLRDSTFYAEIFLKNKNFNTKIDSRPSDAIAIAMRTESPIFVEDHVLKFGQWIDKNMEMEDFKDFINNLKPEDFEIEDNLE
jgi:hypothetical protein